jgi:hypothetical protein
VNLVEYPSASAYLADLISAGSMSCDVNGCQLATLTFASWNHITRVVGGIDRLRRAAAISPVRCNCKDVANGAER